MNIIDARWETSEERKIRVDFHQKTQLKNKDDSLKYCNNMQDKLVKWYNEFALNYTETLIEKERIRFTNWIEQIKLDNKIFEDVKNDYQIHYCNCGGILRYIKSYDFVGCSDYKLKKSHNSYRYRDWQQLYFSYDDNKEIIYTTHHLQLFKEKYEIPKNIKTYLIVKTLRANGIKLLGDITEDHFLTAKKASNNSTIEEAMIKEMLTNKFKKVSYQQGIKYLTNLEYKWQTKIPDYICQNDDTIFVFDAKKNIYNTDNDQLTFYHNLVDFIRKKSNVNKEVKSYFILFDPENVQKNSNCLTINDLKTL